jgi:acetyl esterase/lipase
VVTQLTRDDGGLHLAGQLLVTPVTDADPTRPSFQDNGEGYLLTADLMRWFWDHYADPADRADPRAAPLLADRLDGLPPAVVVTAAFDPLRDEGTAYAEALAAAGVPVRHIAAAGHTHTSILSVDLLPSGVPVRAALAEALRSFLGVPVPA